MTTIDHAQATFFAIEQMTKYLQEKQALNEEIGSIDINNGARWYNACKRALKKSAVFFGTSDVDLLIEELKKIDSGDCAAWVGNALINSIKEYCND